MMQVEFFLTTHNSILTMGAMGPVGGSVGKGMAVAGASAAASTASIAAVNSSMNADGDLFKQLKTISKDTWDTTTSKESVQNIVIAAAAGGLATGLTNMAGGGTFTTPNTSPNIAVASSNPLERVGANFQSSFQDAAINTVSSSAAQSAVNGDSFIDALKDQGKNILIYTAAKVAANEVGRAYHGSTVVDANGNVLGQTSPTINQPEQLLLHASLGAATSALTGNNAASGAIAGVIGELAAEGANKGGVDVSTSIQIANLSGAISSVTYGGLTGQSVDEMANNAWEGSRIATNAAANNAVYAQAHLVQINEDLKSDSHHFSWLIIPDDQETWKNHPDFKDNKTIDGKVYATIGGGPDKPIDDFAKDFGLPNLHGGLNREPFDTNLSIKNFTTQINPSLVGNENIKIQQILNLNQSFESNPNKPNYWFYPEQFKNSYNSNSYFTGIGRAAGLPIPQINIKAPGYNKPLPMNYFINSN